MSIIIVSRIQLFSKERRLGAECNIHGVEGAQETQEVQVGQGEKELGSSQPSRWFPEAVPHQGGRQWRIRIRPSEENQGQTQP